PSASFNASCDVPWRRRKNGLNVPLCSGEKPDRIALNRQKIPCDSTAYRALRRDRIQKIPYLEDTGLTGVSATKVATPWLRKRPIDWAAGSRAASPTWAF